ncbi:hypothetical protein SKAU_G00343000 [Synaphobranchus kaupii]|uniref:Immunoglobulin subtype domain-containing protein n=1 Tax=Synaphobranchus kaupii TaxID=118154 RepID=A0A9Q1EJ03_SYNKA|nr:hypothetical protein SKAU_G00343000 [Synaphobranchus kaupii]
MKKLKTGDSGYYWCAVEINYGGDKGSYLDLSVTAGTPGLWVDQQEVTGVEGGHVSVQCHYNEPNDRKSWCRAGDSCIEVSSGKSGRSEIKDVSSEKVFIVTVRELNREDAGCPSDLKIVLMVLGILLLAVAVAMVTWRLWKRHGGRGSRSSEEDVTYSTVFHKKQSSHRESPPQSQPSENPPDEVMYSSIVSHNPQPPAETASDVIYSTVVQ